MDCKEQLGFFFLHIYIWSNWSKKNKTHQNDAKTVFQFDQYT